MENILKFVYKNLKFKYEFTDKYEHPYHRPNA